MHFGDSQETRYASGNEVGAFLLGIRTRRSNCRGNRSRGCRIPVGIIDLLFVDRNRNYVVVEIKRPSADYREVVGQIATYMGWVRKNIAGSGQTVRGIIVVGEKNERLAYSVDQVPDVSVRPFF